jgi:hypothetical protein
MPTFATTEPVALTLELVAADVELLAGSHDGGTTVEVLPSDDTEASVKAAASTTVEYSGGKLLIRTPKQRSPLFGRGGRLSPKHKGDGAIKVVVRLAAGSTVEGEAALAHLTGRGRLGRCRFKAASGDITLGQTGPLWVQTALGAVTVEAVDGPAHVVATQGKVDIGRADSDVEVKTANGDIRIGEVRTGKVRLSTTVGSVKVGVRSGTSALLDVSSLVGSVVNELDGAAGPAAGRDRVEVSARTLHGDVVVHRA